jgi:hypothetical protein
LRPGHLPFPPHHHALHLQSKKPQIPVAKEIVLFLFKPC